VLNAAYATHPERFVSKPPTPLELPTAAWINKPKDDVTDSANPETTWPKEVDVFRSWIWATDRTDRAHELSSFVSSMTG
jgi:hypothetical protein